MNPLSLLVTSCIALSISACSTQHLSSASNATQDPLQDRIYALTQEQPSYSSKLYDLNADGYLDAIVKLQGQNWCGSGGCTLFILQGRPQGSFLLNTKITVADTPIYILKSKHHDWLDLSVYSRGVGQVRMIYDGTHYPSNPSLLAANPIQTTDIVEEIFLH